MAQNENAPESTLEIDRMATQLAKDPQSKVFLPLAEEYGKVGMWQEAASVLEDGMKYYPGFITAMVALGCAYDHMGQATKAKAILEESVKLSPENLRAHRTLIKIYTSQGLKELALQSCAVILTVNPHDEEALTVQSALGGPRKHKKEPVRPKPAASVTRHLSARQAAAPPAPAGFTASAAEESAPPAAIPVSTPLEPGIASTDPQNLTTEFMETTLGTQGLIGEQLAVAEPDSRTADSELLPPPSPQAGTVAQLEAWLHTIEARRHDRDATNESNLKTS